MAVLILLAAGAAPAHAADGLSEARRLYNLGQYDSAARLAREAMKVPATIESARLVLGRIHLERFRRSADAEDLTQAREALRAVNAQGLERRERAELAIGLGEWMFLDEKYGPAAELFERALQISATLGPEAHDRVLDWWATSMDRLALSRPREMREMVYVRILDRMEEELATEPSSSPAWYWLAAAARGTGNLDRAWHAAMAGWVSALLARDRGAALRADLDRLMTLGIIPERAARLQPRDVKTASDSMLSEWEAMKTNWTR